MILIVKYNGRTKKTHKDSNIFKIIATIKNNLPTYSLFVLVVKVEYKFERSFS